jgi:hypothetical protein
MIKCHGSQNDPKIYGEPNGPDAITTQTLKTFLRPATVVGTMCCYGAQIFSPREASDYVSKACAKALNAKPPHGVKVFARGPRAKPNRGGWPLASTYLRDGALGFVGPTVTAYSGDSEMQWGDWVVAGYLNSVLGGASIGRAFQESKQDYLRWLNQQGQAPGLEEEVTFIEYVLLGDPSITPITYRVNKLITPGPEIRLGAEELQARRVARRRLAYGLRKLLPERKCVTSAKRASAGKLFTRLLRNATKFKKFKIKPSSVYVERVYTPLHGPMDPKNAPIKSRESLQYYWSGERFCTDKQKQICLLKAETDPKTGKLRRTELIHSS